MKVSRLIWVSITELRWCQHFTVILAPWLCKCIQCTSRPPTGHYIMSVRIAAGSCPALQQCSNHVCRAVPAASDVLFNNSERLGIPSSHGIHKVISIRSVLIYVFPGCLSGAGKCMLTGCVYCSDASALYLWQLPCKWAIVGSTLHCSHLAALEHVLLCDNPLVTSSMA